MSKLIQLIQLWGGCSDYLITLLQKLQNRAARIVTKLSWYTPTRTLLKQCGWLSIRQLIYYHNVLMVYRVRQSKKPQYFHEKFGATFSRETRLSSTASIRENHLIKKDVGLSNFTHKATKMRNDIPESIRV